MRLLLLALQLAQAPGAARQDARSPADTATFLPVVASTRTFLMRWRVAWQETQRDRGRHRPGARAEHLRELARHCHFALTPLALRAHVVTGPTTAHATCPTWYPAGAPRIEDERLGIDGALDPSLRPEIRERRDALRALLRTAARAVPADVGLARLRVRFALDAGDLADAWSVATACDVEAGGCGRLRALVLHRGGPAAAAHAAYLAAAAAMPDSARCAWNDVRPLLDEELRRDYARLPCDARADLEARLWWLADPLWLEPGNERRAEHFARRVQAGLLEFVGDDERQRFAPRKGGESVVEGLVRYGWPSQMYWTSHFEDDEHAKWLLAHGADTAAPYVVREYTRGRLHTMPASRALLAPLRAAPDDWQLTAPARDDDWWPVEHYARDRSRLVQLPAGQSVMLRRHDATRFVWAGDLDAAALARRDGDGVRATLFASRDVGRVETLGAFAAAVGRPLVVHERLRPGAALLGIELPGDEARAAARTRFGVEVPATLAALAGGRALSAPLLFDPPRDAAATVALDADDAIGRMLGTTTLAGTRRVGIYWESYGFAATDTVDVEVRITRRDRPGVLERLLARVAGRDDGETVGTRWREQPGSSRAIQLVEGDVPLQMRSLVLDLGRLEHGRYAVSLAVRDARGRAATSEREIALR